MNWFSEHAAAIQAIASLAGVVITAVLAGITYRYVRITRDIARLYSDQVEEMKSSRIQTVSEMKDAGAQTREMINQATVQAVALAKVARATEESAESAKASADALRASLKATMNERRARIRIEAGNVIPVDAPRGTNTALCWFSNYGLTPAFIKEFRARYLLAEGTDLSPDYSQCRQLMYDETVQQDAKGQQFLLPLEPTPILTSDDVLNVRGSNLSLHFYGFVKYQDVFERNWRTTVHLRWKMRFGGMIEGAIMEYWEPVGAPEDNRDIEE